MEWDRPQKIWVDALTGLPVPSGGVMALGNFDGVHLGHKAVIAAAADAAKKQGVPAYAMTFEPHPYTFFQKEPAPFRLTSVTTKTRLLRDAGAQTVVTLPFTPEIAELSADAFLHQVLLDACAVKHVVVGFNFTFGAGRRGDSAFLRKKLEPLGIDVTEVQRQRAKDGETLSSSRIRKALAEGNLGLANAMLGRPFALEGVILPGDRRGHTLDMPTANMVLGAFVRPLYGVYAIVAHRIDDDVLWPGVANIGIRPTIGDQKELLEFHLFDFSGSLYGESWAVELRAFLRPEEKFTNLDRLKAQIRADASLAQKILAF